VEPDELEGECTAGDQNLCLAQGRFDVKVVWETVEGLTGSGQVVPLGSAESGLFYFFSESNWEMLVKVLDACGINQNFWVFAAATTNVGYTLTVTDTVSGQVQEYTNPVGVAAPAITDTSAFPVCDQ
jgi:hypothetical protein